MFLGPPIRPLDPLLFYRYINLLIATKTNNKANISYPEYCSHSINLASCHNPLNVKGEKTELGSALSSNLHTLMHAYTRLPPLHHSDTCNSLYTLYLRTDQPQVPWATSQHSMCALRSGDVHYGSSMCV